MYRKYIISLQTLIPEIIDCGKKDIDNITCVRKKNFRERLAVNTYEEDTII